MDELYYTHEKLTSLSIMHFTKLRFKVTFFYAIYDKFSSINIFLALIITQVNFYSSVQKFSQLLSCFYNFTIE